MCFFSRDILLKEEELLKTETEPTKENEEVEEDNQSNK